MSNHRPTYYKLALRRHAPVLEEAWQAEHLLIAAILEQAIHDACTSPNSVPLDARLDAQRWFQSRSETGGSFRWCCRELGQDWRAVLGAIRPRFAPPITQRQYLGGAHGGNGAPLPI